MSSLASTKKLEWDSGADIGYINFYNSLKHCRKSKSFPSLNMDLSAISSDNKLGGILETTVTDCVAPSDSKQLINVDKNPQLPHSVVIVKDKKGTFKHSTPHVRVDDNKPSTSKLSSPKSKDECLQTTLIRICSRGVQTDDELPSSNDKLVECKSLQTDALNTKSMSIYNSNSVSGSSSSKTGSFKYIRGSDFVTTKTSGSSRSTTSSEQNVSEKSTTSNVQKSSSSRSTQSSIINSPLGKIISSQQSNHLIADIDKSLNILQHFIKSKNYNPETKQYYAKKIVSKIIESRYIDDSTSTSNISVNSSNKSSTRNNSEQKVLPTSTTSASKTNKVTKSVTKSIAKSLDNIQTSSIVPRTSKSNSCPISRTDLKNWREEKTLSEKILDEREKILKHSARSKHSAGSKLLTPSVKSSENSDYLIQHSKKERKRQISWINHELSYLQKLKDLLQKNNSTCHSKADNSEYSDSVLRGLGDHNSTHSNSDIEDRFRKIFGSATPESVSKLSKYLTTDQIKYLIDNDAKKLHCPKCECCTNQAQSLQLNINEIPAEDCHTHGQSYNSHCHNIYKDLVAPKTASKEAKSVLLLDVDEANNKNDVSIQCTLKKKKKSKEIFTASTETTTESTSALEDKNVQTSSHIINEPVKTFYKNSQDLTITDSTKCSSESEKMKKPQKMTSKSPIRGKDSIEKRKKPFKFLKSSMAYYLTFEEDSQHEMSVDDKSSLETVTVKIPKFKYRRNNVIEEQKRLDSEKSNTLQVLQFLLQCV